MDYRQPDFYNFSQDSIEFAHFVSKITASKHLASFLDLACGCGVVGIEIINKRSNLCELVSLDVENEYKDYYIENAKQFIPNHKFTFLQSDFKSFSSDRKFDCIISNPPYFLIDSSRPNPDPRTNRARRWSSSDQADFLKVFSLLHQEGQGYFLSRIELPKWQNIIIDHRLKLKIAEVGKVAGATIINVISFE